MGNQVKYFPVISLKEMAMRRIAVVLVNKPDFLATSEKFPVEDAMIDYENKWFMTVSWMITDTVSKLLLPVSLTSEMIPIFKAVNFEVVRWRIFHKWFVSNMNRDFSARVAEKLCWTTAGTVDYRKTSEILVRSAVLDKVQRFELACFYCLEDCIPILWKKLSEEVKRTFHENEEPLEVDVPNLQLLLPYILKKHSSFEYGSSLAEVSLNSLKYAALCGNKAATEYCLKKFPVEIKESLIIQTALQVLEYHSMDDAWGKVSVVFHYLLSQMSLEEQLRVFKEYPCEVLACFLAWPWQDLFLDIADVIWTFLPEDSFYILLHTICSHMNKSGYYLPNMVQEFFLRSPRNFRKFFADNKYLRSSFFEHFFHAEDSQTIKIVFRSLDADDRVRLVFCRNTLTLLDNLLLRDGYPMVEVYIRAASLSKEDRKRLREAFVEFVQSIDHGSRCDYITWKRNRFLELLDKMDASIGNKRSAKDKTVKKLRRIRPIQLEKLCIQIDHGSRSDYITWKRNRFLEFPDKMDASIGNKRSAKDKTAKKVRRIRPIQLY